jgi:hypothetical protein
MSEERNTDPAGLIEVDGPTVACHGCGYTFTRAGLIDGKWCLMCYKRPAAQAPTESETPAAKPTLRLLADYVVQKRGEALEAKRAVEAARAEWEALHRELILAAARSKAECEAAESDLRSAAEEDYWIAGNKHPLPGVNIRILKTLDYDLGQALEWAKANAPALLTIDRKEFEKFARAHEVPCVVITEEPQVTIAPDLAAELAKGDGREE